MPTESEIIARIRQRARYDDRVRIGIGDDAAVIRTCGERDLLASCDLSVESVHFRTEWAPPYLIGRKALAVTLSDIAAMGGVSLYAMVSVALPAATSAKFVDEIFRGIFQLAEAAAVGIIGGDISSSPDSLFIDTSVIGECASGRAVKRSGARPGDVIYVTGSLGGSRLGLWLLERGARLDNQDPHLRGDTRQNLERQALLKLLAPEPRLEVGQAIGRLGVATAMIDISDGLSTDLGHILEESKCGAVIQAESIPLAESSVGLSRTDEAVDPLELALHGGEEYELLFTSSPDCHAAVEDMAKRLSVPLSAIGRVVRERGLFLSRGEEISALSARGYEHLS